MVDLLFEVWYSIYVMKIINSKTRKSVVILFENIEEDLDMFSENYEESNILIQMWREKFSEEFFKNNSDVDDVLLLRFDGSKRILEWVMSKETRYNSWIYASCELIKSKRDWLDDIMNSL